MPVPPDLVRVHLNWTTGVEEIAVSTFMVRLNHEPGANTNWPEMVQDLSDKVFSSWTTNIAGTNLTGLFPTTVALRDVSTYHLDAATGHTLDKGLTIRTGQSGWGGSSGQPSLPLEVSVATSLYGYTPGTFVADRARKRGRMYLPPMATTVMSAGEPNRAGRLSTSAWNTLTAGIGAFFNDMQGKSVGDDPLGVGQTWELVVHSRVGVFTTPVQAIRVGDVLDVQTRRRNKQREVYKDVAITR